MSIWDFLTFCNPSRSRKKAHGKTEDVILFTVLPHTVFSVNGVFVVQRQFSWLNKLLLNKTWCWAVWGALCHVWQAVRRTSTTCSLLPKLWMLGTLFTQLLHNLIRLVNGGNGSDFWLFRKSFGLMRLEDSVCEWLLQSWCTVVNSLCADTS